MAPPMTTSAFGFEAFGRSQAVSVRRMTFLSLLFHGGVIVLGSTVSPFLPIASIPDAVPLELTDAPASLPAEPPAPVAPIRLAKRDSAVATHSPSPRVKASGSADAHRWLEKLDAGLAAVPRSQVARVTGRTEGIPVRRRENKAVPRAGDFPPAGGVERLSSDRRFDEREARLRASARRGAGVGVESEASVMFGAAGSHGDEPVPGWIRDMIRRKVRERLPELETAYSEALGRNPDLKGRLLVRFRIGATGRIERAEPVETSIRDAPFTEAILEKVRRWTFEPTQGRTVDVLYPLLFFVPS